MDGKEDNAGLERWLFCMHFQERRFFFSDIWRWVILPSVPVQVYHTVLLNWIKKVLNKQPREKQADFRPNRSYFADQIHPLRTVKECSEFKQRSSINFIDFHKAFDSLHCPALWSIPRYYGIPMDISKQSKTLMNHLYAVMTSAGTCDWITVVT